MSEEQVAEVSQEVAPSVADTGDWRSQIPEDIAGHKSLEHIQDVGSLAKSYVSAQSMIGADKIAIPGKYATDEDWAEVDMRLGRPETPDGYNLENKLPEGIEADEQMLSQFSEMAHKVGLRPNQAQSLLDWYNTTVGETTQFQAAEYEAAQQSIEKDLQREFGPAYQDSLDNAVGITAQFGSEEMTEIMLADGTRLGDNPDFIRMNVGIANFISERIGEDTLEGVKTSGQMTTADIQTQINDIDANPAYMQKGHPQQPFLVSERLRLQEMLNNAIG